MGFVSPTALAYSLTFSLPTAYVTGAYVLPTATARQSLRFNGCGDQMITGTVPPSTDQAAPATFDAASEQRNAITAAISSSDPKRPSGVRAAVDSSTSSRVTPRAFAC